MPLKSTGVSPSLLDRLVGERQDAHDGPGAPQYAPTLDFVKSAVRRDIEALLNTRQRILDKEWLYRCPAAGTVLGELGTLSVVQPDLLPEALSDVRESILSYGIPDVTGVPLESKDTQERMVRMLHAAITRFEPRLEEVRVLVVKDKTDRHRLSFRITAKLKTDPVPELISLDAALEVDSGEFSVKG